MTKVKNLKDLNKKQLDKLRKGILAVMENSTNVQQPIAVNEVKRPMPFPSRDSRENQIDLGKGLDRIYGTRPTENQEDYPEGLNPFDSELKKRKLSALESEWLSYFKSAIVAAKSPSKMHEVVNEAIKIGMRMNGRHENWSFAEYVVLGMQTHKFKKNDQKKIMHKLMLKGAEFHNHLLENKLIGKIYKELQPKVQPQIEKQLEERRKAAKSAVRGGDVIVVEMDNETTFTEYSKGSTVEVAQALKDTGPNKELGSHIIKIDGGELEIRKKEGDKRNYTDVLGGFEIIFPTSIGELVIIVYHDVKNYDQIQVRVVDTEMFLKLQTKGEEIGKNCLFGGMKIEEAVKRGSFPRSGFLSEQKAASKTLSSSSWEGRISGGSQETIRTR